MLIVKLETEKLNLFLNMKGAKCYHLMDEGYATFKKSNSKLLDKIITMIALNQLTCTIEVIDKGYSIYQFYRGTYEAFDSLTRIDDETQLDEYINLADKMEDVRDLLTVTATTEEDMVDINTVNYI